MTEYKFSGKYIIKADLKCITGLHIGGTDEGFEIGGMDNPVVKDPITGYPYIPGSSLKGKMRSLIEWAEERVKFAKDKKKGNLIGKLCDCGSCDVCIIFGCSTATTQKEPTRLTVRDSYPKGLFDMNGNILPENERKGTILEWKTNLGENIYTEVKTENAIDRLTSEANPRPMERVPSGSVFEVEMIFDIYRENDIEKMKKIFEAMSLLEDSALGGGGSRGSGKIKFENIKVSFKSIAFYTKGMQEEDIKLNGVKTVRDIFKKFDELIKVKL